MATDWDSTRTNGIYQSDSGLTFSYGTSQAYFAQSPLGWVAVSSDLPNKPHGLKVRKVLVKGDVTAGLYRWVTVATKEAFDDIEVFVTAIKIQNAVGDEEAGKGIRMSGERWRGRQRVGT